MKSTDPKYADWPETLVPDVEDYEMSNLPDGCKADPGEAVDAYCTAVGIAEAAMEAALAAAHDESAAVEPIRGLRAVVGRQHEDYVEYTFQPPTVRVAKSFDGKQMARYAMDDLHAIVEAAWQAAK
jgi:hypothetical protein